MASNVDRKDKGQVEASSAMKEARNFDPHMFKNREAIGVQRSFSWACSWASVREKALGGTLIFPVAASRKGQSQV